MHYKYSRIAVCILVTFCSFDIALSQYSNYDYENWPGKNGSVKSNIELQEEFITVNNLDLTKGSKGDYFFYRISLDENDSLKEGRLQCEVFSTTIEAQKALVECLNIMTKPIKPPRLLTKDLNPGDVAFGEEQNGIYWMTYVRNNVLIVIHAPTRVAVEMAQYIDERIKVAPIWNPDEPAPSIILSR